MIRNSEVARAKCLIYFLLDNKKIVYVGESQIGIPRIFQHRANKKFDDYIYVCEKQLPFLKNYYFRRYYERRWIKRFKPKYNFEPTRLPPLNEFLIKMYLWAENPQPEWVKPLTKFNTFFARKLEGRSKNGKVFYTDNQYSKVHSNLNINQILYINNELAFKFLANEKPKKSLGLRYTRKFNHRKENIYN